MANPATRLIHLIMLLQRRPNQKAADLARELGVSVRTLHRYFQMLDELGIPVYSDRGPYGGFSLVRGYKMPPLVLTLEESVAVFLGTSLVEEMWGQVYREAARGALAKLENVLPDEQRAEIAWARRALVATGLQRSDLNALAPTLDKLRRAVRELRKVELTYHAAGREVAQQRMVDPFALVLRWGWWYLVGYCHLRQSMRTFRVDRIEGLSLTGQVFHKPVDFDIHAYLTQERQFQTLFQARLRFAPHAAQVARYNRAYWEALEDQPDGSVVVTMNTPDLNWAASNVLAYGPIITVLEPEELRSLVVDWAGAITRLYSQGSDEPEAQSVDLIDLGNP
jgi:predicted DNA-binding transcriptional regulator YafY